MDKTQEETMNRFINIREQDGFNVDHYSFEWGYEACLEANGIGGKPMRSVQSESYPKDSSAPEWVIDMIRTGKPVRCLVSNGSKENPYYHQGEPILVYGYHVNKAYPFWTERGVFANAEPIPTWKPREGEAVLVGLCDESGHRFAQAGVYADGIIHGMGDEVSYGAVPCIPFDESKRGKPWSEI